MDNIIFLNRERLWLAILCLTIVSFPWHERINSVGIALLALHWVLDKDLIQKIKKFRVNLPILIMWLFFLLHLVALPFSSYIPEGIHSIEVKISLLLLPLFFATENYFTKKNTTLFFTVLCVSTLASFIYATIYSAINFGQLGLHEVFKRMNISAAIMHPGYYSNYFALGFIYIMWLLMNKIYTGYFIRFLLVITNLIFFLAITSLSSKTILIYLFIFVIYFIWYLSQKIKNQLFRIICLFSLFAITIISFISIPNINYRIYETIGNLSLPEKNIQFSNSTGSRKVTWKLEWGLIKQQWLTGYGTGESNPLLLQEFKKFHFDDLALNNMHTHNQIFHTWLDLGLLGLLLLVTLLLYCLWYFYKEKSFIGIWLVLLIIVNTCTDDMLEIQASAVFLIFFLNIMLFQQKSNKDLNGKLVSNSPNT